jgi:integrase
MDKHVLPVLGSRYVEDITWTDIQQLYNDKTHLNCESKRKLRTVLNIVFNGAIKDGYIKQNPTSLVKVVGKPSTPRAILTVDQMVDIISNIGCIQNEGDRRYMALAVPHAMIPEEILGLRWEDIDLETMQISIRRAVVHPKRNQPVIKAPKEDARIRTIDIVPGMEQYIAPITPLEGYVFGGDAPLSFQAFRRLYERVGAQINLYGATTYNFRHTVLTDAYDAIGDVKAVQAQAGHATPAMTMGRYVHGRSKTKQVANSIAETYKCDRLCDKPEAS